MKTDAAAFVPEPAGTIFGKTSTPENLCSINGLHAPQKHTSGAAPAASPSLCPGRLMIILSGVAAFPPAAWDSREIDGSRGKPGLRRAT
jgi:hypothetical protein